MIRDRLRGRLAVAVVASLLGATAAAVVPSAPSAAVTAALCPTSAPTPVSTAPPAGYYRAADGLTGAALHTALHTIVGPHTAYDYNCVWDALAVTDADPDHPGNVIEQYSGFSIPASKHVSSCAKGTAQADCGWNREHTWAKSHGDFDTYTGPGTDLFHLRPEDATTNSTRNNLDFDDSANTGVPHCAVCRYDSDSFEPRDAIKGDIARGLLYMAIAYDGADPASMCSQACPDLELNDVTTNSSSKAPYLGKLSTLLRWSAEDPPDATERLRNEIIYETYQHNRNPFIDHPEYAAALWGDGEGVGSGGDDGTGTPTDPGTGDPGSDPGAGDPGAVAVVPAVGSQATLTGDAKVDTALTAHPPTWNVTGVTTTYDWFLDSGAQPIVVDDPADPTYVVQSTDAGHQISVRVTGAGEGLASGSSTSARRLIGKGAALTAPVPTAPAGTAQVGQVLTAPADPIWSRPAATDHVWLVDGRLTSEFGPTYVVRAGDVGTAIQVRYAGANPGYLDGIVLSEPTAAVVPAPPAADPDPGPPVQPPALGTPGHPAPVTSASVPTRLKARARSFTVTFAAAGAPAAAIQGRVRVYDGKRLVGTFTVTRGRATIKLRTRLAKGRHRLRFVLPASATSTAYVKTVKVRVR